MKHPLSKAMTTIEKIENLDTKNHLNIVVPIEILGTDAEAPSTPTDYTVKTKDKGDVVGSIRLSGDQSLIFSIGAWSFLVPLAGMFSTLKEFADEKQ